MGTVSTTSTVTRTAPVAERLRQAATRRRCTLLAIGPMSKNCVDTVIELGEEVSAPLILIASRRQIETAELGGGYVNHWTTESFAEYVRAHDRQGNIILARDHGGPWQNTQEAAEHLLLPEAMASCQQSYEADITAGFEMLHLDPSVDIHEPNISQDTVIERLFTLYDFCVRAARDAGRELIFEVGAEEQSGEQENLEQLESFLRRLQLFCQAEGFPEPHFVVVQTGTKVKELENVGLLNEPHRQRGLIPPEVQITKLVEICERFGVWMKEHNTDYLPDEVLAWHPRVGIHAANVAPEFGVAESRQLLRVCTEFGLRREQDEFLRLAYDSGKWQKWLKPDTQASDYEKSIIAGHYVFALPEFADVKQRISYACEQRGVDLDRILREYIKHQIRRYLHAFNLY